MKLAVSPDSVSLNNLLDQKYYEYYLMPGRYTTVELSASF